MMNCSIKLPILTPVGDVSVMWSMMIIMPLISLLGIIGNILSFIILKHCSEKISSFFYIRCLTIFDSFSLIFTMFGFYTVLVLHPVLINYQFYAKMSDAWVRWGTCQLRTYLAFTSRSLSIWTIVIFTAERSIGIKFPMLSLKICTIPFAKIVVGILVPVCMLCNMTWLFSFDRRTSPCTKVILCQANSSMLTFRILDFLMLSAIPAALIIICNVTIIVSLRQRRRLSLVAYEEPKNKKRDRKIAIQLLTVSTAFVLLTFPSLVSTIINTLHEKKHSKVHLKGVLADFYHISMLLFTLNFAINFCLYCFVGKNFRYAAYSLLFCRLKRMRLYRDALFDTVSETKSFSLQSKINKGSMEMDKLIVKTAARIPSKIQSEV